VGHAVIADRSGRLLVGGTATLTGSPSTDRALLARYSLSGQCGSLDTSRSMAFISGLMSSPGCCNAHS
jgi:hypothetical protein